MNDTTGGSDTAGHATTGGSSVVVGVGVAAGAGVDSVAAAAGVCVGGAEGAGCDGRVATANGRAEALLPIAMLSIVATSQPSSFERMKPAATGPVRAPGLGLLHRLQFLGTWP
jgi:hypothetical protein